jgi:voltage-dependent calcium channel L type alpha-1D
MMKRSTSSLERGVQLEMEYGRMGKPAAWSYDDFDEEPEDDTPVSFPKLKRFAKNIFFKTFLILVIIANSVFLCLDGYPQTKEWENMLSVANYTFVSFFAFEMLLKLIAFTPYAYLRSYVHKFDLFVVLVSVLELILIDLIGINGELSLSAFRAMRLLRILRLTSEWKKLRLYAYSSLKALSGLGSLALLNLLWLLITSLVGMQLFGGKNFWSRTNFDTFSQAFITSFQLQTAEGWNEIYMEGIQASGGAHGTGMLAGIFFIAVVAFGFYVLFGIILAIAYQNLSDMFPVVELRKLAELEWIRKLDENHQQIKSKIEVKESACFVFSYENGLRKGCNWLVSYKYFDGIIMTCIIMSSLLLAFEDYVDPNAKKNEQLAMFDIIFVAIFTLEMLVKMIAYGVVLHPNSYFRDGWNILDFIIVVSSVASLVVALMKNRNTAEEVSMLTTTLSTSSGSTPPPLQATSGMSGGSVTNVIRVVRTLRVLRPLRTIERFPGLQIVVQSMLDATRRLWGMILFAALVLLCFTVTGVSMFKGRFSYCTDLSIRDPTDCSGNYSYVGDLNQTLIGSRKWETHYLNFDTFKNGLITLVTILGFEDWPVVFHNAADSTLIGKGPIENNRMPTFIFFLVYLVLVGLFFVNIVMAFVVLMYREQAEVLHRKTGLSRSQMSCLKEALHLKQTKDIYHHRRGHKLLDIIDTDKFEMLIVVLVVLNVVVMMMFYQGAPKAYLDSLDIANNVFVGVFVVEMILKMFAYTFWGYFKSGWNVFDFVVVVGSLVDIALASIVDYPISILRVFRAVRLVKLLNHGDTKYLFTTCLQSIASVTYVMVIIGLMIFIYGIVGMVLFARLPLDFETSINPHNNFRNIGSAMLCLVRVMTGESWQTIMKDTHIEDHSRCDLYDPDGSTCGSGINVLYFTSFYLITQLLLLNILVAVIVDNFEFIYQDSSDLQPLHVQAFGDEWRKLDPRGSGTIHHARLINLLKGLDPPFGLGKRCPTFLIHRFLAKLIIPIDRRNHIGYRPTLVAIIRVRMNLWIYEQPTVAQLMGIFTVIAPTVHIEEIEAAAPSRDGNSIQMLYTVCRLQAIFRANKAAKLHPIIPPGFALAKAIAEAEIEQDALREKKFSHAFSTGTLPRRAGWAIRRRASFGSALEGGLSHANAELTSLSEIHEESSFPSRRNSATSLEGRHSGRPEDPDAVGGSDGVGRHDSVISASFDHSLFQPSQPTHSSPPPQTRVARPASVVDPGPMPRRITIALKVAAGNANGDHISGKEHWQKGEEALNKLQTATKLFMAKGYMDV